MILGIGTDIIEIYRVKKAIESESFLKRNFTPAEIALISKKGAQTAAGNFAAKEALVKALGTGFSGFFPIEIEVLRKPSGAPFINLTHKAYDLSLSLGVKHIKVSISHSKEYAVAYVILED